MPTADLTKASARTPTQPSTDEPPNFTELHCATPCTHWDALCCTLLALSRTMLHTTEPCEATLSHTTSHAVTSMASDIPTTCTLPKSCWRLPILIAMQWEGGWDQKTQCDSRLEAEEEPDSPPGTREGCARKAQLKSNQV